MTTEWKMERERQVYHQIPLVVLQEKTGSASLRK